MTSDDRLRDALRRREREIRAEANPEAVLDDIMVRGAQTRSRRPIAIGVAAALVGLVGIGAWTLRDDRAEDVTAGPYSAALTSTVTEALPGPTSTSEFPPAGGWLGMWLSSTTLPASGAPLVATVLPAGGTFSEQVGTDFFGVEGMLDRWDDGEWVEHRQAISCFTNSCLGGLYPLGESVETVAVGINTGSAEYYWIEGLDPGFYRLRKDDSGSVLAAGVFEVVDRDVVVPPIEVDGFRLDVAPHLLADSGQPATVTLSGRPMSSGSARKYRRIDREFATTATIRQWNGTEWIDVGEVALGDPADEYITRDVAMPPLAPGAYQLVRTRLDGTDRATGEFWVLPAESPDVEEATAPPPENPELRSVPHRVIVDGAPFGGVYDTAVIADGDAVEGLINEGGLAVDFTVDFATEVVLVFDLAESGSQDPACALPPLRDLVYDEPHQRIYPALADSGEPTPCEDDANPHRIVVAVERSALPEGPFSLWIDGGDPTCCEEGVTFVAAGELTAPASQVPALDAEGTIGIGETRIAYGVSTHCGLETIIRPIDGRNWAATAPIPGEWGAVGDGGIDLVIERVAADLLRVTAVGSETSVDYAPLPERVLCE